MEDAVKEISASSLLANLHVAENKWQHLMFNIQFFLWLKIPQYLGNCSQFSRIFFRMRIHPFVPFQGSKLCDFIS